MNETIQQKAQKMKPHKQILAVIDPVFTRPFQTDPAFRRHLPEIDRDYVYSKTSRQSQVESRKEWFRCTQWKGFDFHGLAP